MRNPKYELPKNYRKNSKERELEKRKRVRKREKDIEEEKNVRSRESLFTFILLNFRLVRYRRDRNA